MAVKAVTCLSRILLSTNVIMFLLLLVKPGPGPFFYLSFWIGSVDFGGRKQRGKKQHTYTSICVCMYTCVLKPQHTIPHHTVPDHIVPHRAIPHPTTPGQTTPQQTTPHCTTPGRTTPNQTKPPWPRKVKIALCVLYLSGKLHWIEETS